MVDLSINLYNKKMQRECIKKIYEGKEKEADEQDKTKQT